MLQCGEGKRQKGAATSPVRLLHKLKASVVNVPPAWPRLGHIGAANVDGMG